MKKNFLALGTCAFALALGLVACGEDGSSNGPTNDHDFDYGEFTDARDGQVYKTVTIGTQTWMAENLNYDPGNVSSMGSYAWSGCYDNESSNCTKYGRLYTWEVAMDDASCGYGETCNASLNPSTPVRGVCPSGWHLPSHREFEELINFIDPSFGYNHTGAASSSTAGKYLKSKSGWYSNGNGTDAYGFSALPGGNRGYDGYFYDAGDGADFWSSGEDYSSYAFRLSLLYGGEGAYLGYYGKDYARSVRCLKD
ncbi:MAG: fibrobacter succinogenes major paralogous domain-containing protein [Fibrobacter sp.]|nr:fibrobacter succinogenes major paralogous domain-containing protein [Fibrobacter sp.]